MNLPNLYLQNMYHLLGQDVYTQYLDSLSKPSQLGIRINRDKISVEDFIKIAPFAIKRIPWTKDGFYVLDQVRPAKHPYYYAGLYYIQEPSAMAPVNVMAPQVGQVVLDLCSAPGGKTLQIAADVGPMGTVVANDISASRLRAVIANIERFGLKNCIVIAEDVSEIAEKHRGYYDAVLIDAPCSGEGMFRKSPELAKAWTEASNRYYADVQRQLTTGVGKALKQGAILTYSTCTFSPLENEATILKLLSSAQGYTLLPIDLAHFQAGVIYADDLQTKKCARLYPFALQGEGHFIAKLQFGKTHYAKNEVKKALKQAENTAPPELVSFMNKVLKVPLEGVFRTWNNKVYLDPANVPNLEGMRVLRRGWYLGNIKHGKFEPAHGFAMGLMSKQVNNIVSLSLDDYDVLRYLKCETITWRGEDGWYVVCVDGYPLGWAKLQNGRLKNKYPAHLRLSI